MYVDERCRGLPVTHSANSRYALEQWLGPTEINSRFTFLSRLSLSCSPPPPLAALLSHLHFHPVSPESPFWLPPHPQKRQIPCTMLFKLLSPRPALTFLHPTPSTYQFQQLWKWSYSVSRRSWSGEGVK